MAETMGTMLDAERSTPHRPAPSRQNRRMDDRRRRTATSPPRSSRSACRTRPGLAADRGRVELVARRPVEGERELLDEAELDLAEGLVGDRWSKGRSHGRPPNLDAQVTLMSARAAELVAGTRRAMAARRRPALRRPRHQRRPTCRPARASPWARPSWRCRTSRTRGCKKFVNRFGMDAMPPRELPPKAARCGCGGMNDAHRRVRDSSAAADEIREARLSAGRRSRWLVVRRRVRRGRLPCSAALRENGERDVRLVGTDMSERSVGRHLCDAFQLVPAGIGPGFADAMLEIVEREGVDAVVPQSSFDLAGLAEHRDRVPRAGAGLPAGHHPPFERQGRELRIAAPARRAARPSSAA